MQCFFCFSVVKMFAQNKEDKKRVEKALELCGVSTGKVSYYFIFYSAW